MILWTGSLNKGESQEFPIAQWQDAQQVKITYGNASGFIDFFLASLVNLSGTNYEILYQPITQDPFETYIILPVATLEILFPTSFFLLNSNSSSSADNSEFTVETIVEETTACPTCQRMKPIPQCTDVLEIGNISLLDTDDVVVVLTRKKSGTKYVLTGTTDVNGLLSIDLTDYEDFLTSDFEYEIMVFETIDDYKSQLPINVNGTEYDCLIVPVDKLLNPSTGNIEGATLITLQIDSN